MQNSAFVELDEGFYALMKDEPHHLISGSTVLAAMIIAGDLWVANAGDSRAVLSTKSKPEQLSEDHKPNTETERLRIEACGASLLDIKKLETSVSDDMSLQYSRWVCC